VLLCGGLDAEASFEEELLASIHQAIQEALEGTFSLSEAAEFMRTWLCTLRSREDWDIGDGAKVGLQESRKDVV